MLIESAQHSFCQPRSSEIMCFIVSICLCMFVHGMHRWYTISEILLMFVGLIEAIKDMNLQNFWLILFPPQVFGLISRSAILGIK